MGFRSHNLFGASEKASGGLSRSSNTDLSRGGTVMSPKVFALSPGLLVTLLDRSVTLEAESDGQCFRTPWGLGSRETGLTLLPDPYRKSIR